MKKMKKLFTILILLAIIGLSANAQTAYITNYSDNTVSVINVATNIVTASIHVGSNPMGVSVSPDGSKVYVTNASSNTVSVINTATNTVTATIAVGAIPAGVSVSPNGSKVFVANEGGSPSTISVINTATNSVSATIWVNSGAGGVAISPDGSNLYITGGNVSVMDISTNTISAIITVGSHPAGVSVSPDGSKVYVTNENSNTVSVINTATNTVSATITVGSNPVGVSVSPDGNKVYVANQYSNTVSIINTATNTVTFTVTVGSNPNGVSVSPDGSKVYVVNESSNTVSIINTATNTVSATIAVGIWPFAIGNFISTYKQPTITQTNVSCYGGNNGTATVDSMVSGTPPYTYLWNTVPPQTTNTATGLSAGTYTVTITDAHGIIYYPVIVTITQPPLLIANAGTNKTIICGGTAQLDNVTTNYSGTLSYLWSPSTGLDYDSVPNPKTTVTSNTTYTVTVTTPIGCTATSSVYVNVNPLIAEAGINKSIICGGSAQLDNVTTNYSGTGILTYQWTPLTGLNSYNIANPITSVISNNKYFVAVSTPNGCVAVDSVTVNVNPLIVNVNNTSTTCGIPIILNSTNNYTGSGTLTYNWQPSTGLSSTIISNPIASPSSITTYTVTLTTPNSCTASHNAIVSLNPLATREICFIEFDTATSKNSINWGTSLPANIDSTHIYVEVSTNVWSKIGSVLASQNHFIDVASNPFNQSYSYKISVKDTCGLETDSSAFHTTITLLAAYDQGTDTYGFTWSAYQGLSISNYYLYGIMANGTKTLIGSVPGNQYFYNYTNPYLGFIKYFIGFNTPVCTNKVNHLVRSNYVQSTIASGLSETEVINNSVSIYPNPAYTNITIESTNISDNETVSFYNMEGQLILNQSLQQLKSEIDISDFSKGIYFIKVKCDKGVAIKKFIKE